MAPRVAVVYNWSLTDTKYSVYGHVHKLALAELAGLKKAGINGDLYQVKETLSDDLLKRIHALPQPDVPIVDPKTLESYDGFLFGIPTRFGNFPSQWRAFWDATGPQWAQSAYSGKYAGLFISTAALGGGQESTALAAMSTLAHHGMVYVPLGYKNTFQQLSNLDEVHGGSPWGAGTFADGDGSRQPSKLELEIATLQGEAFGNTVKAAFRNN